jgi:hypothetical protein
LYLSYFCLIGIAILCYFEQLAFTFCSLRGKAQVRSLLCFVIEEPPENAENKRAFKFPFVACEIFTCDVEVIFKTLVEDDAVSGTTLSVFTLCRGIICPLKSLRVDPWPVQLFLF